MRRKIMSLVLVLVVIFVMTTGNYGVMISASQEIVPGIVADSVWNYDQSGFYVANVPSADPAGSTYRFSTTANGYGKGAYQFYLYSGNFDQDSSFEGALYFFNNSADTPAGNGISFRWGAGGMYMSDKNGNKIHDISGTNATIKEAWVPNTWYYIVFAPLTDGTHAGRIAMNIKVMDYDEETDTFTLIDHLNGGNYYWPCRWDDVDPTMQQITGYVHVTANTAIIDTVNTAYTTKIKSFWIDGYSPTPLNATSPVTWSVQGSSITIDADGNYRAISNGVSTITATANNISDSVQIKVVNSGFAGMKMNSGIWVNSLNGLYVAGGDTDIAVISTTDNTYSFGEYTFKLYSGSFDEADFEGALYFFNSSPNVPQGNGISLRWNKDGLFICDSEGEVVYNMTHQFLSIRNAWKPNTWYGMTLYLLSNNRIAFGFKVLSYNEATDSYTIASDPNNGNPYWLGDWTEVDSGMQQSSGYVHFTLNSAVVEGERKYYDAKIDDFSVVGYGGPSYTIPAFESSELAISDHDIIWSRDKKTAYVYIDPDTSKDVALSIANFTQATYPQFRILNTESSGVTVTKLTEDSIGYSSSELGSGYADLLIDFMELDDGTVVGGRQIRVVFEVQILATGITVIGMPETSIDFGAFGKLTAIVEPANATSSVIWSIVEGRGISIDAKGNYVAVYGGTATIRATIDGFTDEVTISVSDRVAVSDITLTGVPSQSISVGSTGQISANVNPANAYDDKARIRVIQGRSVEFNQATGDYKAVRKGSTVFEVVADGVKKKFTIVVK